MNTDRWIEMDLFFFQQNLLEQAREVIERFSPLWKGVQGDYGLMLCCGWICDLVTEWDGSPTQRLPFRSPSSRRWAERSYSDLRNLFRLLKEEAKGAGLPDLKIGIMIVGWGKFNWGTGYFYDMDSGWFDRHPEVYFPDNWKNPDFRKRLNADKHQHASRPNGIVQGMSFGEFFSGQWAMVSRFLELDAILLRDGFLGPCIYEINGPFGTQGTADPKLAAEWSAELIAFYSAVKQANPECLVMGYSSARSAIAEYRIGCFNLEALVAAEAIDVWIDQTWAGAWQDWWSQELRGWTFQLANLITHEAMIAGGNASRKVPCRHYHLIETWDAWEPWDTIHQVPGKLRWGIWAFAHASVLMGDKIHRTTGAFISWANNWEHRLLGDEDVSFLKTNLNAASVSAEQLEEVYGPILTYNPGQMEVIQNSDPSLNTGELIDDHAAFLMKWGFPCLAGGRLDELPEKEAYLLQTPASLSSEQLACLTKALAIACGCADRVDDAFLERTGLRKTGKTLPWGKQQLEPIDLVPDELPRVSAVNVAPNQPLEASGATVLVRTRRNILLAQSQDGRQLVWQPQYPYTPGGSVLRQHMYGSLAPFVAVARCYHDEMKRAGYPFLEPLSYNFPATFHFWRSGGIVHILLGNLETGICGDSRMQRQLTLVFPKQWLNRPNTSFLLKNLDDSEIVKPAGESDVRVSFRVTIDSLGSSIYQLVAS